MNDIIGIKNVSRTFTSAQGKVKALDGVDLSVQPGEFVVVHGPSGCGKSTLLFTLGGMLRPSSGSVLFQGRELYALSPKERSAIRKSQLGFVFQMFHLVPYLNIRENILLASSGDRDGTVGKRADSLIARFGLNHRAGHKPGELSIGERQRAAVARAMMNEPKVILADEPTGNLDADNARQLYEDLSAFHKDGGTVVVVSHGTMADPYAGRLIQMKQGRLIESGKASA